MQVPTDMLAATTPASGLSHSAVNHVGVTITSITPTRDVNGEIRYFRYGTIVTHWEIKHELPGRLRLKNPLLHRKKELCQAIERELMGVLGIDYFKTNPITNTVLVQFDQKQLNRNQIIEILETASGQCRTPQPRETSLICTFPCARPWFPWRQRHSSLRRCFCPWLQ